MQRNCLTADVSLSFVKFNEEIFVLIFLQDIFILCKMSLIVIDEDPWLLECTALQRLAQEINNQISERDTKSSSAGKNSLINCAKEFHQYYKAIQFFRIQQNIGKNQD